MTYPPFTLGGSIHNKEEFTGRYFHFLSVINPASLIKSEADIRAAEGLLLRSRNEARGGVVKGYTNKELWDAQTLVQSAVHPDTGEIIPKPFRMSGYVPFNLPILVGLLVPQGTAATAFWQWTNQTHNALINYSNRNAKTPVTTFQQVSGYSIAVGTALLVSFGCAAYLKKNMAKMNPKVAGVASALLPFGAVAVANVANTAAMRNGEISTGIEVYNPDTGEVYGNSKEAAKKAIALTCFSRVVIAAGCLALPPVMTSLAVKAKLIDQAKRPKQFILAQFAFCAVCFFSCLPGAIALFPQYRTMPTSELEPELAAKIKAETVTYNKGL